MKLYKNYHVIFSLFMCFSACLFCINAGEAAQFKTNLTLGAQIDAGHGKVKITKISEATKTPIYAKSTKAESNKFVIIETVVTSIDANSKLESIAFALVTTKGVRFDIPSAYGKVKVFGKLSDYEATDGAVVYAYEKGDALNLFFEVPQSTRLKDLKLTYVPSKK
jgi:hypothetical protein